MSINPESSAVKLKLKIETNGVSWSNLLDVLYRQAHKTCEIHVCTDMEPTLEPRLSAVLANCKMFNRHAKTIIHSNLQRYDENVWREIIRCNTLDELHVLSEGYEKAEELAELQREMGWVKPCIKKESVISVPTR